MDFDEDDLAAEFDRDGDATLDTEEMKPRIAAYTLKWWLRVRPIQIAPDTEMAADHALRLAPVVNEGFAMLMAFHLSTIPYKKIPVRHSGRLLYSAHYRDTDPGVMAHFLEVMRDAWAAPAAGGAAPPPPAAA